MARRLCIVCNTRPQDRSNGSDVELCTRCFDYAGWENTHSDDAHDAVAAGDTDGFSGGQATIDRIREEMKGCPVCLGNDPANEAPRTGHTNTRAHSHNTHGACKHRRTAKDRAACRKANRFENGVWVPKA